MLCEIHHILVRVIRTKYSVTSRHSDSLEEKGLILLHCGGFSQCLEESDSLLRTSKTYLNSFFLINNFFFIIISFLCWFCMQTLQEGTEAAGKTEQKITLIVLFSYRCFFHCNWALCRERWIPPLLNKCIDCKNRINWAWFKTELHLWTPLINSINIFKTITSVL